MSHGVALAGVLVTLAVVSALWAMNASHDGPTALRARHAETEAQRVTAGIDFTQAAQQLETFHAENGTYSGATLPPSFAVVLVRADAVSYCLQSGEGTEAKHEVGPGGSAAGGAC